MAGSQTFPVTAPSAVPTPPAGYFAFFIANGAESTISGNYYKKDWTGAITALIPFAYTDENAQDAVGGILSASGSVGTNSNIQFFYDDSAGTITAAMIPEAVQDIVGAMLSNSDGTLSVSYNDAGNVETVSVGTLVIGNIPNSLITRAKLSNMAANGFMGNNTGAAAAPQDLTVAQAKTLLAMTSTDISDFLEAARDAIGAMLIDSSDHDVTYNDAGDTETILLSAFTGAVVKAAGSLATSIAANAISNTELADMAALRIKGALAAGDPVDLTAAQLLQIINSGTASQTARFLTANIPVSATTAEITLATLAIPANGMEVGATYRGFFSGYGTQGAVAHQMTARLRVGSAGAGGSGVIAAQAQDSSPAVARTLVPFASEVFFTVRSIGAGTSGSALGGGWVGGQYFAADALNTTQGSPTPVTFDTTTQKDIALTIQLNLTTFTNGVITAAGIHRV